MHPPTNSPSRLWAKPDTKSTPTRPHAQSLEDLRWKWAGSTILLSYGQMAAKAKSHILPWVDNILSRMIFYFRFSSWVQVALFTLTPVLHLLPPPTGSQRGPGPPLIYAHLHTAPNSLNQMGGGLLQSKCWIFTWGGHGAHL